jgi:hypothetical protein
VHGLRGDLARQHQQLLGVGPQPARRPARTSWQHLAGAGGGVLAPERGRFRLAGVATANRAGTCPRTRALLRRRPAPRRARAPRPPAPAAGRGPLQRSAGRLLALRRARRAGRASPRWPPPRCRGRRRPPCGRRRIRSAQPRLRDALFGQRGEVVVDVGLEPGHGWVSRSASSRPDRLPARSRSQLPRRRSRAPSASRC